MSDGQQEEVSMSREMLIKNLRCRAIAMQIDGVETVDEIEGKREELVDSSERELLRKEFLLGLKP